MKSAAILAILMIALLPSSTFGQEARYGCTAQVAAVLESVGLNDNNITRKQDLRQYAAALGRRRQVIRGLHIWIWPRDCDGRFIIDLDRACRVTNTYTTGECSFEGHDHAE